MCDLDIFTNFSRQMGFAFVAIGSSSPFRRFPLLPRPQRPPFSRRTQTVFVLKTSSRSVSESVEEDILQRFFKDRQISGDFISKASDTWQREVQKVVAAGAGEPANATQQAEQVKRDDDDGGFLKLSRTQEWLLGDNFAPMNRKAVAKLKRELMLLSVGIGTACSGYCLIVLSVQAAVSYAVGVLFSLLPAMVGVFAYKSACLVQVYSENEDLQFVFPENEEQSSD